VKNKSQVYRRRSWYMTVINVILILKFKNKKINRKGNRIEKWNENK